jgi:molecular chaperone HscB
MDYFRFFGLDKALTIDSSRLQQRFYELSREYHPDRFSLRPPAEQARAQQASAFLNDGYRVLRDPIGRAEYVLKQEGFDIGEQRTKDVPAELLEEVFELNMALEDLRQGEENVRPQLEEALGKFLAMNDRIDTELGSLFSLWDEGQDRAVLQSIRGVLNRRRYIRNLIGDVEKELARTGQAAI